MMKMSFKMSLKEMDRENSKYGSRKLQAYWGGDGRCWKTNIKGSMPSIVSVNHWKQI